MTRKEKRPRRARKRKEMMRRKNQRRERERRPPKRRKMMTMKNQVRRRNPKNPEQPAFKAKYFATCWCNSNTLLPLWLCRVVSLPVISANFGRVYHAKKQAFTVVLVLHAYTKAMRFRSIHSYVCVCVCTALDTCQVSYDAGTTGGAVVFAWLIFDWRNLGPKTMYKILWTCQVKEI